MLVPSRPDNALSFADWLIRHGFEEPEKGFVFTAGMTAQLYGPLDAWLASAAGRFAEPVVGSRR
jgi:hypothetical protein